MLAGIAIVLGAWLIFCLYLMRHIAQRFDDIDRGLHRLMDIFRSPCSNHMRCDKCGTYPPLEPCIKDDNEITLLFKCSKCQMVDIVFKKNADAWKCPHCAFKEP